ncbi:MAG: biotin--[acetyl-CoA-carboxylase] ligase [Rubrivivax sp.]
MAPTLRLHWPLAALRAALPGVDLQVVPAVGSTNTELIERQRHDAGTTALLVAEAQLQGRGRSGRAWRSEPGRSLTFSLARPLAPADWSGLSLAVGAVLADAIEPLAPGASPRLQLKWPNDLWLADPDGGWRKLGGILIETVAAGERRVCIVGVGLNLQSLAADVELSSGCAGATELDATLDVPALLQRVAPPLVDALGRFEREGLAPFRAAYDRRDLLRGRAVATSGQPALHGVAEGVDTQGLLCLRTANGLQRLASGEVSVRPLATALQG